MPITDEYLAKLRAEIERTNIGAHRFHTLNASDATQLNIKTIDNWLRGLSKSALQSDLDYVLARYREYPTWLVMKHAMFSQFRAEVSRTGIDSPGSLVALGDLPEGLNSHILYGLFDDTLKGIREDHWSFIMETLAAQKDAVAHDKQVAAFNSELQRSGVSFSDLSGILSRTMKRPLKAAFLRRLAKGQEKNLTPEIWDTILDTMSALPQVPYRGDAATKMLPGTPYLKRTRIEIDNEKRAQLNGELERTGAVLREVGKRVFSERQKVRSGQMICRWRTGTVSSAPKQDWDRVMDYLMSLPDKAETQEPIKQRTPLKAKRGPKKQTYTVKRPDAPKRRAVLSNTDDDEAVPDLRREEIEPPRKRNGVETYKLRRQHKALGYVVITEELYQRLHAERQRTLVSARRLVASSDDAPGGLRSRDIDFWLLGKTLAAEARYLDWTFEAYQRLPTAPKK